MRFIQSQWVNSFLALMFLCGYGAFDSSKYCQGTYPLVFGSANSEGDTVFRAMDNNPGTEELIIGGWSNDLKLRSKKHSEASSRSTWPIILYLNNDTTVKWMNSPIQYELVTDIAFANDYQKVIAVLEVANFKKPIIITAFWQNTGALIYSKQVKKGNANNYISNVQVNSLKSLSNGYVYLTCVYNINLGEEQKLAIANFDTSQDNLTTGTFNAFYKDNFKNGQGFSQVLEKFQGINLIHLIGQVTTNDNLTNNYLVSFYADNSTYLTQKLIASVSGTNFTSMTINAAKLLMCGQSSTSVYFGSISLAETLGIRLYDDYKFWQLSENGINYNKCDGIHFLDNIINDFFTLVQSLSSNLITHQNGTVTKTPLTHYKYLNYNRFYDTAQIGQKVLFIGQTKQFGYSPYQLYQYTNFAGLIGEYDESNNYSLFDFTVDQVSTIALVFKSNILLSNMVHTQMPANQQMQSVLDYGNDQSPTFTALQNPQGQSTQYVLETTSYFIELKSYPWTDLIDLPLRLNLTCFDIVPTFTLEFSQTITGVTYISDPNNGPGQLKIEHQLISADVTILVTINQVVNEVSQPPLNLTLYIAKTRNCDNVLMTFPSSSESFPDYLITDPLQIINLPRVTTSKPQCDIFYDVYWITQKPDKENFTSEFILSKFSTPIAYDSTLHQLLIHETNIKKMGGKELFLTARTSKYNNTDFLAIMTISTQFNALCKQNGVLGGIIKDIPIVNVSYTGSLIQVKVASTNWTYTGDDSQSQCPEITYAFLDRGEWGKSFPSLLSINNEGDVYVKIDRVTLCRQNYLITMYGGVGQRENTTDIYINCTHDCIEEPGIPVDSINNVTYNIAKDGIVRYNYTKWVKSNKSYCNVNFTYILASYDSEDDYYYNIDDTYLDKQILINSYDDFFITMNNITDFKLAGLHALQLQGWIVDQYAYREFNVTLIDLCLDDTPYLTEALPDYQEVLFLTQATVGNYSQITSISKQNGNYCGQIKTDYEIQVDTTNADISLFSYSNQSVIFHPNIKEHYVVSNYTLTYSYYHNTHPQIKGSNTTTIHVLENCNIDYISIDPNDNADGHEYVFSINDREQYQFGDKYEDIFDKKCLYSIQMSSGLQQNCPDIILQPLLLMEYDRTLQFKVYEPGYNCRIHQVLTFNNTVTFQDMGTFEIFIDVVDCLSIQAQIQPDYPTYYEFDVSSYMFILPNNSVFDFKPWTLNTSQCGSIEYQIVEAVPTFILMDTFLNISGSTYPNITTLKTGLDDSHIGIYNLIVQARVSKAENFNTNQPIIINVINLCRNNHTQTDAQFKTTEPNTILVNHATWFTLVHADIQNSNCSIDFTQMQYDLLPDFTQPQDNNGITVFQNNPNYTGDFQIIVSYTDRTGYMRQQTRNFSVLEDCNTNQLTLQKFDDFDYYYNQDYINVSLIRVSQSYSHCGDIVMSQTINSTNSSLSQGFLTSNSSQYPLQLNYSRSVVEIFRGKTFIITIRAVVTYQDYYMIQDGFDPIIQDENKTFYLRFIGCQVEKLIINELDKERIEYISYQISQPMQVQEISEFSFEPDCDAIVQYSFKIDGQNDISKFRFINIKSDSVLRKITINIYSQDNSFARTDPYKLTITGLITNYDGKLKTTSLHSAITIKSENQSPPQFKVQPPETFQFSAMFNQVLKFPELIDLDGDEISRISVDFGRANQFISGSFPNFKVSPDFYNMGEYPITITVTDDNNSPLTQVFTYNLIIVHSPIKLNQTDLENGTNNVENSQNPRNQQESMIVKNITLQSANLQASIKSISNEGLVRVDFNRPIVIPQNYSGFNDNITLIEIYDFEDKILNIKFTWQITQFSTSDYLIQINFNEPQQVSKNGYDNLKITFKQNGYFIDQETRQVIKQNYQIQAEIPKQLRKDAFSKAFAQYSESLSSSLNGFTYGTLALNVVLSSGLWLLWSMINTVQILVHMPLLNTDIPSNAIFFYSLLIDLSNLNVLQDYIDKVNFFDFTQSSTPIYWNTDSDKFAAIVDFFMIFITLFLPLFVLYIVQYKYNHLNNSEFKKKYDALFDKVRLNSRMSVLNTFYQMIRRLIFALSVVFLGDYQVFQIQILTLQSVIIIMFIVWVKPFDNVKLNNMEMFNELCILLCCYHMITFTNYLNDVDIQYNLGWTMIFVSLLNILVNAILMFIDSSKKLKPLIIRLKDKCKQKLKERVKRAEELKYLRSLEKQKSEKIKLETQMDQVNKLNTTQISQFEKSYNSMNLTIEDLISHDDSPQKLKLYQPNFENSPKNSKINQKKKQSKSKVKKRPNQNRKDSALFNLPVQNIQTQDQNEDLLETRNIDESNAFKYNRQRKASILLQKYQQLRKDSTLSNEGDVSNQFIDSVMQRQNKLIKLQKEYEGEIKNMQENFYRNNQQQNKIIPRKDSIAASQASSIKKSPKKLKNKKHSKNEFENINQSLDGDINVGFNQINQHNFQQYQNQQQQQKSKSFKVQRQNQNLLAQATQNPAVQQNEEKLMIESIDFDKTKFFDQLKNIEENKLDISNQTPSNLGNQNKNNQMTQKLRKNKTFIQNEKAQQKDTGSISQIQNGGGIIKQSVLQDLRASIEVNIGGLTQVDRSKSIILANLNYSDINNSKSANTSPIKKKAILLKGRNTKI
eukprot:403362154